MENYITNGTDWRQFRKSTHLASADLDIMKQKGHSLIFTIAHCQHEFQTNINGKKQDATICYFTEQGIKPMVLNSKNRNTLSGFARAKGVPNEFIHMVENWIGLTIELFIDPSVKMKGEVTGGIRIKAVQPKSIEKQPFTREMFEGAKKQNATIETISQYYIISEDLIKEYNEFLKLK